MASSITPNIPNIPNSSGLANHLPVIITGTAATGTAINAATTIKKNRRETLIAGQENRRQFHQRAKAYVEDYPRQNPDLEGSESIVRDYLETGGVTGLNPEEATANLQKYGMINSDQKVVIDYRGLCTLTREAVPVFGKANLVVINKPTSAKEESKLGSNPPESFASMSINKHYQTKSYRGTLAAVSGKQGCAPSKVLYKASIAPSLESYAAFYFIVAALFYTIAPPFFKKSHSIIHGWLGLKDTNVEKLNKQGLEQVIVIIESYNKKSLQEKQARLLLAHFSLFKEPEIDQLLSLRSDKLP